MRIVAPRRRRRHFRPGLVARARSEATGLRARSWQLTARLRLKRGPIDPDKRAESNVSEALPEVSAVAVPDEAWLLDVREDDEWAAGHVPGATHIPLGQLGARTAELPHDEQIYVICRSGNRSARVAQALNGAG